MADPTTDLGAHLDSLKYMVAVPGAFTTAYPDTTDPMLLAILMDGFAEAQLYGLFTTYEMDDNGIVTPGLTRAEVALVVLLAAIRMIQVSYSNAYSSVTYKAGSAEYSTTSSAAMTRDILAALLAQRKAIIDALLTGASASAFYMADQYMIRVCSDWNHSLVQEW